MGPDFDPGSLVVKQLFWIDLLKNERKQDCIHVDHNQLDDPLPLIIICINIVVLG